MSLTGLVVNHLASQRGGHSLFQALDFELKFGEVLQILGQNGVGKSTLLKILTGLRAPDQGSVRWQRQNILDSLEDYQAQLSYLGHHLGLKAHLTVLENLHEFELPEIQKVLAAFSLTKQQHVFISTLSQGQKQRVALARVILSRKKLWILDEPFAALDQVGFELMQNFIKQHISMGGCVVLSSHRPLEFDQQLKTLHLERIENV